MKRKGAGKTQAPGGPASSGVPHRDGVSVNRWGIILFALAAVVVLCGIGLARIAAEQGRSVLVEREAHTAANLLAAGLSQAVSRKQHHLAVLTSDEQLVAQAVASGEPPASMETAFPLASGVSVLPRGYSQVAPAAEPPLGYALLDMLRAVERDGRPVPPEVHRLDRGEGYVHFIQPLTLNGSVEAHLLLSYPEAWLTSHLPVMRDTSRAVLEQRTADGEFAQLIQVGSERASDGFVRQADVGGTPWRVRFTLKSPGPLAVGMFADPVLLAVAAGSVLILGGCVLLVFTALQRRVKADALAVQSAVVDALRGQLKSDYPVKVRELRVPMMAVLKDGAEVAGGTPATAKGERTMPAAEADVAKGRSPAKDEAGKERERPKKSVAAPTRPAMKDLLSGLEVEENMPNRDADTSHREKSGEAVQVDRSLFRAYDIRGIVGKGLSEDVVRVIGRAIGSEAVDRAQTDVVVGYDGRLSSPDLADALMDGLRSTGVNVVDVGRVPTPVVYFATHHLETGSGVMVTGSHNPPDYNGLKIVLGGETLSGDAIAALHDRIERGAFVDGKGDLRRQDVLPEYLSRIVDDVSLHRPLRIVVDCGNGVAGEVAPDVFRSLGCEVEELYCDVDGTFPNHHPDPSEPGNLLDLIGAVRDGQADVGLAFDGDGDRLGVVDSGGKVIWPDRQMMLYATDILTREPGSDIIFDVKCSAHLARIITENAGVPVMWRTGHSLIKAKLKESGAPLAGEMSGHIFFNDRWYGFDDGIYTAARLLEILAMDGRDSAEIFAELPETVSTPELKIHLEEGEPPEVIRRLVGKASFPNTRVTTIDGLRVDFPDGWGLVRASNTTPCLVLRFEADNELALERIKQGFRDLLEAVRPGLDTNF